MTNLAIAGIGGLIVIFLDLAASTSFINFGAFTALTLVTHHVRQRRAGQQLNRVSYVVVPVIGAVICAYLLAQFTTKTNTLGITGWCSASPSWP